MAIDAGDVVWHIKSDLASFQKGLKTSADGAKKLGKQFGAVSKKISLGSAVIGVGMVGLVKKSNEFSAALSNVNTLGIEDLEGLGDSIKAVNAEFAVGLVEGAEAAYQAISAGASEAETPLILERAAIAAKAGVSDLTTAIDFGTSVVNAFGLEMSDMNTVFDEAQVAIKLGKTTMQELGSTVGKLAPLFSSAGLSSGEMLAGISALTSGGIATSEAVTGLKAVMQGILKPTSDATKIAEGLGIQFDLAGLQAKGFAGFMQDLAERTGGDTELLSGLFGSMEAGVAVMSLAGNQAGVFSETIDAMKNSAGVSKQAFDDWAADNPGFVFNQMKAKVENLAESLGSVLTPAMSKAVDEMEPHIVKLTEWVDKNKELSVQIGLTGAAIVGLGIILGPVTTFVGAMVTAMGFLVGAVISIGEIMMVAVSGGLALFISTVVLAGVVIGAAAVSVGLFIKGLFNWNAATKERTKTEKGLGKEIEQSITRLKKNGGSIDEVALKTMTLTERQLAVAKAIEDTGIKNRKAADDADKLATATANVGTSMGDVSAENNKLVGAAGNAKTAQHNQSQENLNAINPAAQLKAITGLLTDGYIDLAEAADMAAAAINGARRAGAPGFANGGEVPAFANGGKIEGFAHGGRTKHRIVRVGEQGPELAALPSGSQVMSNPDMMRAVSGASSGGGGVGSVIQNITIKIDGALNGDEIVDEIKAPLMKFLGTGLKEAMA